MRHGATRTVMGKSKGYRGFSKTGCSFVLGRHKYHMFGLVFRIMKSPSKHPSAKNLSLSLFRILIYFLFFSLFGNIDIFSGFNALLFTLNDSDCAFFFERNETLNFLICPCFKRVNDALNAVIASEIAPCLISKGTSFCQTIGLFFGISLSFVSTKGRNVGKLNNPFTPCSFR